MRDDANEFGAALRTEMDSLENDLSNLGSQLTRDLARAIIAGRELDGLLQKLVLKQADSALNKALDPIYDMVGDAVGGIAGTLMSSLAGALLGSVSGGGASVGTAAPAPTVINMSVTTNDAASFKASETQMASSLSRVVSRGARGL